MNEAVNVKTWCVYILQCRDGTFYTGIAINPTKRMLQHNSGVGSKYIVPKKRPVTVVYVEEFPERGFALKREYEIKTWNKPKKLSLINSTLNQVKNWV